MAAPNIVNVATITAKSVGRAVTTSFATILTNLAGSGKVLKINSFIISNITTSTSADISARVYKSGVTTAYYIAFTITVPGSSTLVLISKDTSIYLEEGDYIEFLSSSNSTLSGFCSYEEIS
jgi:hypothetical protein